MCFWQIFRNSNLVNTSETDFGRIFSWLTRIFSYFFRSLENFFPHSVNYRFIHLLLKMCFFRWKERFEIFTKFSFELLILFWVVKDFCEDFLGRLALCGFAAVFFLSWRKILKGSERKYGFNPFFNGTNVTSVFLNNFL